MLRTRPTYQDLQPLVKTLRGGGVIAYPCEGVWGLGCDPRNRSAVEKLIDMKGRSQDQGLILIAGDQEQLTGYIRRNEFWASAKKHWPGAVTCVVEAAADCPSWISGAHAGSVAVRVSDYEPVRSLCAAFGGALVSTSANVSGQRPARSGREVGEALGCEVPYMDADVGGLGGPTPVLDTRSGRWLR